jgi:hypothetical protein
MSALVYHYTDTARLPWILRSGELRPGRSTTGNYPDPDFLWATVSPLGDRTASCNNSATADKAWRSGVAQQIRFTLHADDFEPWAGVIERYPVWTAAHVASLEATAGRSRPSDWRIRAAALPQARWIAVEARSYFRPQWRAVTGDWIDDGTVLGVEIDGVVYLSEQTETPDGRRAYAIGRVA